MNSSDELKKEFKYLINFQLPSAYTKPVRFNHCFNRIILDWLFQDCWYNYLDKSKIALHQLSDAQLKIAVERMHEWLNSCQVLIDDNFASLQYRKIKAMQNHYKI